MFWILFQWRPVRVPFIRCFGAQITVQIHSNGFTLTHQKTHLECLLTDKRFNLEHIFVLFVTSIFKDDRGVWVEIVRELEGAIS